MKTRKIVSKNFFLTVELKLNNENDISEKDKNKTKGNNWRMSKKSLDRIRHIKIKNNA